MKQARYKSILITITIAIVSCGVPKEILQRIESGKKEMMEFPIDYYNVFPTPTFEQWDKDYHFYEKYLTEDIMRTQAGLSWEINGVHTWWCMPSARTHVQLDPATMIYDDDTVIGEWRITCDRRISYIDSAVYADNKIYRNSKVLEDAKEDDTYLIITDEKFNLYGKRKDETKFKKVASRNYDIESKRFLMLYGLSKASAAISFIGMDKEGRLIINSYWVQERKKKDFYITYEAVMSQMIFKRAV